MPELAPFRGLLFDRTKVDLPRALANPSAIADAASRAALAGGAHNVARLAVCASVDERAAAAAAVAGWEADGALVQDPGRAVYRVVQTAPAPPGVRPLARRGVLAAVRLEPAGDSRVGVPARVSAARVAERVATLRATGVQVEPVLGVYSDPVGEVERLLRQIEGRPTAVDVTTPDGVRHQVWRISDAEVHGKLRRFLSAKKTLVLDGHHALAAMTAHRDALAGAAGAAGLMPYSSANYGLTLLCAAADEGLLLRPVHRLVRGLDGFDARTFLARAADFFTVEPVAASRDPGALAAALEATHAHLPAIGVVLPTGESWRLTLDPHVDPRNHGLTGHPSVARHDVNLLHGILLDHVLGLNAAAQESGDRLRYLVDTEQAMAALAAGEAQLGLFLAATRVEVLRHVVEVGDTLPPWPASAFPEAVAGLVMARVDPEVDLL